MTTIPLRCITARSWWQRTRGLVGKPSWPPEQGFAIPDCRSIHTFGMRFAIDVLWINDQSIVVAISKQVKPWQLRFGPIGTKACIELASGEIDRLGITNGIHIFYPLL